MEEEGESGRSEDEKEREVVEDWDGLEQNEILLDEEEEAFWAGAQTPAGREDSLQAAEDEEEVSSALSDQQESSEHPLTEESEEEFVEESATSYVSSEGCRDVDDPEGYFECPQTPPRKSSAENGIASVRTNSPHDERYERRTSSAKQPYFVLKASNGEIIGKSEMYSSNQAMENGINSVKENGPSASTDDRT